MFFPLYGLSSEEAEIVFTNYNRLLKQSREKEAEKEKERLEKKKKEENDKKRKEIYEMMAKNPTTSFSGIMAYGYMLSQLK